MYSLEPPQWCTCTLHLCLSKSKKHITIFQLNYHFYSCEILKRVFAMGQNPHDDKIPKQMVKTLCIVRYSSLSLSFSLSVDHLKDSLSDTHNVCKV